MKQYYNDDGRAVIVGVGGVDYLTVTTFDANAYDAWLEALHAMYLSQPQRTKRHMYTGFSFNKGVHILSGYQKQQPHFMLQCSGSDSDKVFRYFSDHLLFSGYDIKCTRIDIQVTHYPYVDRVRLSEVAKMIQDDNAYNPRAKNAGEVSFIGSSTGDTIYKGKRKSEKFMRIYDKKVSDEYGNEYQLERYEIEFKGRTAQFIFDKLNHITDRFRSSWMESAIKGQMESLPNDALSQFAVWELLERNSSVTVSRAKIDRTISNTARWVKGIGRALSRACRESGESGRISRETLFKGIVDGLSDDQLEDYGRWYIVTWKRGLANAIYIPYTMDKPEAVAESGE